MRVNYITFARDSSSGLTDQVARAVARKARSRSSTCGVIETIVGMGR